MDVFTSVTAIVHASWTIVSHNLTSFIVPNSWRDALLRDGLTISPVVLIKSTLASSNRLACLVRPNCSVGAEQLIIPAHLSVPVVRMLALIRLRYALVVFIIGARRTVYLNASVPVPKLVLRALRLNASIIL